jgi:transcriptional regulator with XRE-family HTH domain
MTATCPSCGCSLLPSGPVLRARREAAGLTVLELAARGGINHSTLYRTESGKIPCSERVRQVYDEHAP